MRSAAACLNALIGAGRNASGEIDYPVTGSSNTTKTTDNYTNGATPASTCSNTAVQPHTLTDGSGSSAKTTSFVCSADGTELIRRGPGQTTLFVGDTEIFVNTSTSTHTLAGAVRYYTLGGSGSPVAGESSLTGAPSGLWYQMQTPQGTATMTMDATTEALSRQEFTPYGKVLSTSSSWPNSRRG
jgi:hypothetical protein